jgi:hypothetical protein
VYRHLLIDLLVLVLTVFAVWQDVAWARWVIGGYAVLMIVLKVIAMASRIRFAQPAGAPPEWVYHLLYGVTLVVLVSGGRAWWWTAGAWAAFWIVMTYSARRVDRVSAQP